MSALADKAVTAVRKKNAKVFMTHFITKFENFTSEISARKNLEDYKVYSLVIL